MNNLASFGPLALFGFLAPASIIQSVETLLVEHKVAEGKPMLEWVGEELRRLEFELFIHEMLADPGDSYERSRRCAPRAKPILWFGKAGSRTANGRSNP